MVRSDNGTEFMVLLSYFKKLGIVHQTSCVNTPQQNGRVERKHMHILNVARAILFQANLPVKFWGEAILTAAYLINRTPSSVLNGRSPYEVLHGAKPDYKSLRVFGSACYVHKASRDKDKFGPRSRLCVFVGYPFGKKGWKVFDIDRNQFFVSRDVVFREDLFPYADPQPAPPVSPPVASSATKTGFSHCQAKGGAMMLQRTLLNKKQGTMFLWLRRTLLLLQSHHVLQNHFLLQNHLLLQIPLHRKLILR